MKLQTLIFLGLVFLMISCAKNSNNKQVGGAMKVIDLDRNDQISIKDYFNEIEIIPLETNLNSLLPFLIGETDKVIKSNDKFYFLNRKEDVIIIFDFHGKFTKRINWKGKGPNEYLSINDFIINRFNGNIEILSPENNSIFVYDSTGNTFIEKIRLPSEMPIVHLFQIVTSDTYILYSLAANAELFFYSKQTKQTIKTEYNLPKWFHRNTPFAPSSRNPFYIYNDSLFFQQIYNGDVYNIDTNDQKLNLRYSWDFGEYNFNIAEIPTDKSLEYYLNLNNKYALLFQVYCENSKYYFTRFKFKNRYKHLIYNKLTNEYKLFDKFSEGFQCVPQWIDDNAIYTFISPEYLKFVINQEVLNEKNKIIFNSIREEDNPIIIKYTFKSL
ncbi:MAG: 6-bladed beta-propeller [Paludibacter sp.]|nr:6-bladed beta-propeller [Paludibacter sp.]